MRDALERQLRDALDIQPSPDFAARVRARVAAEAADRRRSGSWAFLLAVAAAVILLVVVASRHADEVLLSSRRLPALESTRFAMPMAPAAISWPLESTHVGTSREPRQPGAPSVRAPRPRDPEVLISLDEARAIRALITGIAEGRIVPASLPPDNPSPVEIVIPPIVIEPITSNGEGVRP
jgi:hypothetical protein